MRRVKSWIEAIKSHAVADAMVCSKSFASRRFRLWVAPLTRGHSWGQHKDFAEAMARLMEEGPGTLRRQYGEGEAQGPHLRRLSAQPARRDGDLSVLDLCA